MCIVSFLKSAFCVRHCFVQGSEKSGLLVLCLLLHCSCSFGTENQTFLLNFTVEKVNCFIKKWSMIQSMATLGKELTGEWKKCSLEAGALWNFWLWQQSNVLCRQRAWRVDAAVSTAFPTCGARAQSQLYWLRQLFFGVFAFAVATSLGWAMSIMGHAPPLAWTTELYGQKSMLWMQVRTDESPSSF